MKVTFITPVQHDATFYAEGATAALKKADAEGLMRQGLALPADEANASQDEAQAAAKAADELLDGQP